MAELPAGLERRGRARKLCAARWLTIVAISLATSIAAPGAVAAPPIRADAANRVPACVTPDRLMSFLRTRNSDLDRRYGGIAELYRTHGDSWRVRWDYAFFQMALETNFLTFRRADGRPGDVNARQNNFAGLGATGGGVPGDRYPDVSTGVLAQIQHLVAYSGERLEHPVGARTQLKQDDIIAVSARLRRAVTFADLTNRWAADRRYHLSIETLAKEFRTNHCDGAGSLSQLSSRPAGSQPSNATAPPAPELANRSGRVVSALGPSPAPSSLVAPCRVTTASYGGESVAVLIRSETAGEVRYTALGVLEGFEGSMTRSFLEAHAKDGRLIGRFASREAALAKAGQLCPNS